MTEKWKEKYTESKKSLPWIHPPPDCQIDQPYWWHQSHWLCCKHPATIQVWSTRLWRSAKPQGANVSPDWLQWQAMYPHFKTFLSAKMICFTSHAQVLKICKWIKVVVLKLGIARLFLKTDNQVDQLTNHFLSKRINEFMQKKIF